MNKQPFDPAVTPLQNGISLLEASAGTGKTYAIAMLVLRFVVEREIDIKELLVVTFTNAATEELRNRIRARLAEARQAVKDPQTTTDASLRHWLNSLPLDRDTIIRLLELALLDIDQASVFTIHGFCQRILSEHALESGQLFDCELTGDIATAKQACADDFWRRTLYLRSAWEAAILTSEYRTPDALLQSVDFIADRQPVFPEYVELDGLFAQLRAHAKTASLALPGTLGAIRKALDEGKFKSGYALPEEPEPLLDWLQERDPFPPDFSCLTGAGLLDGLNGSKFRKSKNNPLPVDQQKVAYLKQWAIDTQPFDRLAEQLVKIRLHFRIALLRDLRQRLSERMQQQNQLSFDDLIVRLADALRDDAAGLLTSELRQRYRAALIDEFQDTDQQQWFIFSTLFADPTQSLYLIGDPKQAIYKFRGADIYSYFAAQQRADQQYSLSRNWRSHPLMVAGINRLFGRSRPFLLQQPEYQEVLPAKSAADGTLYREGEPAPPLQLWQLQRYADQQEFWTAGKAALAIRAGVVGEIVELLNGNSHILEKETESPLRPNDIAILVRTNPQARDYQQALAEAGVPAVLNSKESVFAGSHARDLYTVLQAVAQPGHAPLLLQALTVDWFAIDGQTLFRLGNDEVALDGWISRFQDYLQTWQQSGLISMMQQLLRREKVESALSSLPRAERRLTDLHHLLELVQQAAIDEHLGVNKTLDWLRRAITDTGLGKSATDEQQLRLESDEDAVKIVTMHSAKGLEYPVVFCPYLWQRSDRLKKERSVVKCHLEGRMIADLGSEAFERRRQQALQEELAEDLRLLYVAVTRAKYRCYAIWADVRSKHEANDSAMAYLLDLAQLDFAGQQQKLQSLAAADRGALAYRQLPANSDRSERFQAKAAAGGLSCRLRQRDLLTYWQMSSYTALSSLSLQDAPELPQDKADEATVPTDAIGKPEQLPKGAHTGNVLHELLENVSFAALAAGGDIAALRDKACLRYGLSLEQPESIDRLLRTVVDTPLSDDGEFRLRNIPDRHCLKEMPFYLSLQDLDTARINDVLSHCQAYRALDSRQMSGYLTGFIDLICRYDGRYYVMDYKSNSLDDYTSDSLTEAMRQHNYGLQYWIYTLVLHRYLRQRLADYDYRRDVGGVKYLFLRGMSPDSPGGVFSERPALADIEKLEALLFKD